ncbi:hypothetical protein ACT3RN_13980, partial [Psychrobacter sp. AOP5-GZ1-6]
MSNFEPFKGIDLIAKQSNIDISDFLNLVNYKKGIKNRFFYNSSYQVIWYKSLYNLGEGNDNRRVEVIFVSKTGYEMNVKLPLRLMFKIPIGSVWKNGLMVEELDTDHHVFTLQKALGEEYRRPNVDYISSFFEKQKKKKKEKDGIKYEAKVVLSKDIYPVSDIDKDANTLIVVEQDGIKFVIHPLTFF